MSLGEKQEIFTQHLGKLIAFTYAQGFQIRMGEVFRTDEQAIIHALTTIRRNDLVKLLQNNGFGELSIAVKNNTGTGIIKTLHGLKLAVDINLFKNGVQCNPADYAILGAFWKAFGPAFCWGGDFPKADVYHFSITHEGTK